MVHQGINMDLFKQENWGHFQTTSNVMFIAISTGFNGGYRISSCSSEGEINHSPIYDLLIKKHGDRKPQWKLSLSLTLSTNTHCPCQGLFFFFHMEALKACPPQQNSKHYLISNSNFLSIRKCFKAFLSSRTHKSILSDICIEHRNSARPILLIERKSFKKMIKIP